MDAIAPRRKPMMSELASSSLAFESLSIHVSCQDGPHAIISFAPQARVAWEAQARAAFRHMSPQNALRKLINDEIHGAPMRLSINASHGLVDPACPPDNPGDFFSPEIPQPWAARLEIMSPDRIGNPTILDKNALLHLALATSKTLHQDKKAHRHGHLFVPLVPHAVDAARSLAGFLEPMLGHGAIAIIADGWTTLGSGSSAYGQRDLRAFRKSSECASALQSALDQAILQYELSPSLASSIPSRL